MTNSLSAARTRTLHNNLPFCWKWKYGFERNAFKFHCCWVGRVVCLDTQYIQGWIMQVCNRLWMACATMIRSVAAKDGPNNGTQNACMPRWCRAHSHTNGYRATQQKRQQLANIFYRIRVYVSIIHCENAICMNPVRFVLVIDCY